VVIENLITSATVVYNYASGSDQQYRSMTSFQALPSEAKSEIRYTWNSFTATVAGLARSVMGLESSTVSRGSQNMERTSETITHKLKKGLSPLQSALERNIMALPDHSN